MARGKMSSGRTVGRPALGQNNTGNFSRPKPAYAVDNGTPRVVSQGKLSKPVPKKYTGGKRLTPDTTPKVVSL
jgi:hypothetical protein